MHLRMRLARPVRSPPGLIAPALRPGRRAVLPQGRRPRRLLRRQHHRPAALHDLHRGVRRHPVPRAEGRVRPLGLGRRPRDRRRRRPDRRPARPRRDRLQADGHDDHARHERRELSAVRPEDLRHLRQGLSPHRRSAQERTARRPADPDPALAVRRRDPAAEFRRAVTTPCSSATANSSRRWRRRRGDGGRPEHARSSTPRGGPTRPTPRWPRSSTTTASTRRTAASS